MLQRQSSGLLATTSQHHAQPQHQDPSMDSVILEEEYDPNYEPTAEEIQEYATFLEMDPVKDKDLMWIAREGLKVRRAVTIAAVLSKLVLHCVVLTERLTLCFSLCLACCCQAPLPSAWKPCKTETDEVYYFNFESGKYTSHYSWHKSDESVVRSE